jgi:hypothetical protein
MAEFFIIISDPELRRFADAALGFVYDAYKDVYLKDLRYVVVASPEDAEGAKDAVRMAVPYDYAKPICDELDGLASASRRDGKAHGAYLRPQLSIIVVLNKKDLPRALYVVAHEFAHHVFWGSEPVVVDAIRRWAPEIDEVLAKLLLAGERELKRRVGEVVGLWSLKLAQEVIPTYVASNYFVGLQTEPAPLKEHPPELWEDVLNLRDYAWSMIHLIEELVGDSGRLTQEEKRAAYRALAKAYDELSKGLDELPGIKEHVHSLLKFYLKRWPYDLASERKYWILWPPEGGSKPPPELEKGLEWLRKVLEKEREK